MKRGPVCVIWFMFFIIFLVLGCMFWNFSKQKTPYFKIIERSVSGRAEIMGMEIDQPLQTFGKDFNNYLDKMNKTSQIQNKLAAYSSWVAALTSLFSIILELKNRNS